jgi:hypothetical protein
LWSAHVPHITAGGGCSRVGQLHDVSINGDSFSANNLTVKQCDQLKVTNKDTQDYELAFGPHDHHLEYPGFDETLLRPGKSTTITLAKDGAFPLHDHNRDKAIMTLVVTPL